MTLCFSFTRVNRLCRMHVNDLRDSSFRLEFSRYDAIGAIHRVDNNGVRLRSRTAQFLREMFG